MLLAACGGGTGADDLEKVGNEPLGVSVADALTFECPNGGVVINQGIDTNRNGKIDKDEISSSQTVCNGEDGEDGADGDAGMTISSIYNVSSSTTDFCTRWVNESCVIVSGRLTKFSNGIRLFSALWGHYQYYTDTTLSDPDQDRDYYFYEVSAYVKSGSNYVYIQKVARTGSDTDRWLFLVYDYTADSMEVWYDTTENNILDAGDLKIETLTKTIVNLP